MVEEVSYTYFPGCSLLGTAREYDHSARKACQVMGIGLEELKDWNCCGSTSAHSLSDPLALSLPLRNLVLAREQGKGSMVLPCAACFNRMKRARVIIEKHCPEGISQEALDAVHEVEVLHLLQLFQTQPMLKKMESMRKRPLQGLKVVCYYGCLGVRPPLVTEEADYENPQGLDLIMEALGAESLFWSFKTDCCGGSLALSRPDIQKDLSKQLLLMAQEAQAEAIVTACSMCQANLDIRQEEFSRQGEGQSFNLPIFFFTELILLALTEEDLKPLWRKHLTSPLPLLEAKGLL